MKKFLFKITSFSLVILIVVVTAILSYVYFDPFMVVKTYSNYSYSEVIPNRDYVSTEMFIKNSKRYNYNSFILGSSRTLGFQPKTWKKYLDRNDSPFSFDASGESIYGIYTKLRYLDSIHQPLKNVLIILCRDATFWTSENPINHLGIKHPTTSRESRYDFHMTFFNAYLDPEFLHYFYQFKMTNTYLPSMKRHIEFRKIEYDSITNEICILDQEKEITETPIKYYEKRDNLFYKRNGEQIDTMERINSKQLMMLAEIKAILDRNKTNYKVILSPLYEQIKFSSEDFYTLKTLFKENLFDFTGKNKFTDSKINFYEDSHFRPIVGESIMDSIY
jgi:hypothetical protein